MIGAWRLRGLAMAMLWLAGSCNNGILSPGDIARPLVGYYTLESRMLVAPDSTGTVLELQQARASLTLTSAGRYATADPIVENGSGNIYLDAGRWSVRSNEFFFASDASRSGTQTFSYDGVFLTRTGPDPQSILSPDSQELPANQVEVWRKRIF